MIIIRMMLLLNGVLYVCVQAGGEGPLAELQSAVAVLKRDFAAVHHAEDLVSKVSST